MKAPEIVTATTKKIVGFYVEHQSLILTTGTIGFSLATTAVTFRNANYILQVIDDAKQMIGDTESKEERNKIYAATIKELAPKVLPILALEAATITCSLQMKKVTDLKEKKLAEASSALVLAQNAISSYKAFQNKAEAELGDEKTKKIHAEVAKERIENNPMTEKNTVNVPFVNTDYLYFDVFGNRYFHSDKSPKEIEEFVFQLSKDLYDGNCEGDKAYVNDIYEFINHSLVITGGNEFGWLADSHRDSETIRVSITPSEMNDHSTLCYELDILAQPLFRTRY